MNDERAGTHYAKLLHEKGFDNVYLLSGGIEKFLETHYELVEGINVPQKPTTKTEVKGAKKVMGQTASSKMGVKK